MFVRAVEKTTRLMAVDFDVGGIDVECDVVGWCIAAFDEQFDIEILKLRRPCGEFVIAAISFDEVPLQPPKGGRASKSIWRRTMLRFGCRCQLQKGIVAQIIMILDIFVGSPAR